MSKKSNKKYNEDAARAQAEKRQKQNEQKKAMRDAEQHDIAVYYKVDTVISLFGMIFALLLLFVFFRDKPVWCNFLLDIVILMEVVILSRNTSKTLKEKREKQIADRLGPRLHKPEERKKALRLYLISALCYRLAVPVLIIYVGIWG